MSVGVIGAGAFGTALAISLAAAGRDTVLWARDRRRVHEMEASGENAARLPGAHFPDRLRPTSEFDRVAAQDTLLLAVPMQKLRQVLHDHAAPLRPRPLVACCKGVELESNLGPVAVIRDVLPGARAAILTGPSFAHDIAGGLPTALTLACQYPSLGEDLQRQLTTDNIRLYRTTDTVGAELGGALKNVIAIACGAAHGAGLGDSARAALITRGYAEMSRMAAALGGQPETLAGLSGFGDLVLTCTSEGSRNYRYGLAIGRREDFDPGITVEGAATAHATLDRAHKLGIDMPITRCVVGLIDGKLDVIEALQLLLARPLKEE
ncbi:NAD(P)H-dependent glycerol-3-phosphate dehydrogenase [Aquicoccus sp. SCR17]|nr:NAD(P)H-dependent glycerol-3-phosphate dehydrogenase [Carideicomes alvinocaridis]